MSLPELVAAAPATIIPQWGGDEDNAASLPQSISEPQLQIPKGSAVKHQILPHGKTRGSVARSMLRGPMSLDGPLAKTARAAESAIRPGTQFMPLPAMNDQTPPPNLGKRHSGKESRGACASARSGASASESPSTTKKHWHSAASALLMGTLQPKDAGATLRTMSLTDLRGVGMLGLCECRGPSSRPY